MRHAFLPIKALALICLSMLTIACHTLSPTLSWQKPTYQPHTLYDYQLLNKHQQSLRLDELVAELAASNVILVGEWHTHPAIHLFEAQLFYALAQKKPHVALAMEQFSRNEQSILNQYLEGDIGEYRLQQATASWPNYESDYRPLIEIAKQFKLKVIAANAPASLVKGLSRNGKGYLTTLDTTERAWLAGTFDVSASPYRDKFFTTMFGATSAENNAQATFHNNHSDNNNSYLAQVAWDETMAESVTRYLALHPDAQVLLVAGAFHVEGGLGIASRMLARNPKLNISIISPTPFANPLPEAMPENLAPLNADYPWQEFKIQVLPLPQKWLSFDEMQQNADDGDVKKS